MGMFHNILPPPIVDEIRKQRDLKTLQSQMDWVNGELSRFNGARLSKWNMSRLTDQLKSTPKNPIGINGLMGEQMETPAPPPPALDMASMQANIERMINSAFSQKDRGREGKRTPSGSKSGSRKRG